MTADAKTIEEADRELRKGLSCLLLEAPASIVRDVAIKVHEATVARDTQIAALQAERDEARLLVAWANNSLYGSQGYFHSKNGGPFDEHHLDSAIEEIKALANKRWQEIAALQARVKELEEALRLATKASVHRRFWKFADTALIEVRIGILRAARRALSSEPSS